MAPAPKHSPPRTSLSQSTMLACHVELESDRTGPSTRIAAAATTVMLRRPKHIYRDDSVVGELERSDPTTTKLHCRPLGTRKPPFDALFWCPRLFHSGDEIFLACLHQRELHFVARFDFVHQ